MTHMKIALVCGVVLLSGMLGAQSAFGAFGFKAGSVDVTASNEEGSFEPQAGAHPFSVSTEFALKTVPNPIHGGWGGDDFGLPVSSEAELRNVKVEAPPGLIGNPTATPRCTMTEFMGPSVESGAKYPLVPECTDATQVGIAITGIDIFGKHSNLPSAIYNLVPQRGQPALFGFKAGGLVPVFAVPTIRSDGDYGIDFNVINIDQSVPITGNKFTFWGVPGSSAHDAERGDLVQSETRCGGAHTQTPPCPSGASPKAFLTNPTDCDHGPFAVRFEVQSWPGETGLPEGRTDSKTVVTHDDEGHPAGVSRCDRVPFHPTIDAKASTELTTSPSGLNFEMSIPDTGLNNPDGIAEGLLKKAVVRLPEGFTLNPSAGEGMGVCTPAQFAAEKVDTQPGEGCPNGSRLGSVEIDSPLLESGEFAEGSLYLAEPDDPATATAGAENPFDSLISLYLVARVVERGVIIKSAGKVDLDAKTGQVTTTFDDLPQLPFSTFKLHFREGGRAPLVTPASCGGKQTVADLYPYSNPGQPTEVTGTTLISSGVGNSSCPTGGLPPFKPGLIAGTINNAAGTYSPFYTRIFRADNEQEMTHFSIKLPPGVSGKLAGVPPCPEAAIAAAEAREHVGGGRIEALVPSCPAGSEIGRTLVGAGVGSVLTYVPGKVYLAGPYHGSNISIVAVTSGVVGPFDIGTVVVREALRINPETAEVFIDATGSDPIPHIVSGVTTHIRDLRVYVDRPEFTLNPTSCERTSTASTILGSGLDFGSEADDQPVTVTTPFQAADCASLEFAPRLSLALKGGTRRGATPAFRAVLRPRPGEANIGEAQVTLPHSEFLEQSHIGTVCTRVQFKEGLVPGERCPPASVYGRATAVTPILSEPLEGPVFLRSSNHNLPDLVAALHNGQVDIALVGRIDSVKGRIRNTFEAVPDAPVTKFVLEMQGGKKGLLVNSTNICAKKHSAIAHFVGQNGKVSNTKPLLKAKCGKARKGKRTARR
jgi:hypothetical protein